MQFEPKDFIYTYSCHENEKSLCALEMRSFFKKDASLEAGCIRTDVKIDPSRSPFIKERIDVTFEGSDLDDLIRQVNGLEMGTAAFKVTMVKTPKKIAIEKRRRIEREIGLAIKGKADLDNPDLRFGVIHLNGQWLFGPIQTSAPVWLYHQTKPHSYSTSLSTRVARAVANIAVPEPAGVKAIDPCCGIGTVLVEALSMGIDIVGSDINPLILSGTRENIAHFGYQTEVTFKDIRKVIGKYDVAIVDMPYNLCSVITDGEKLEMLQSAKKIAEKLVVVTIEPMDFAIESAGFKIVDRGVVKKGNFIREIIVCKKAE